MADINLIGYYNRFDPAKNYDQHLFRAGYVLQSAELNEIQSSAINRIKGIADSVFKDGDIIRDAGIIVDKNTGATTLESGAVYLDGAVRGVPPANFTIPVDQTVRVGIYLRYSVVTEVDDPSLRDPAQGVRNYGEPGAGRLQVVTSWGYDGDGQQGEFYAVHLVENGIVQSKSPPPQLDSVNQAIASYDRDSAGGSYIVSGMTTTLESLQAADVQVFTIAAGKARVNGYPISTTTDKRVIYNATPDLALITAEPSASTTSGAQRINVQRPPISSVTQVTITAEKTVTMTRGTYAGGADLLPDSAILQIMSVSQGGTTYTQGTDYRLNGGAIDWSLPGTEPAPGSSYSVTYRYIKVATISNLDDTGFTVSGAVPNTLILTSYYAKVPRIDRLCLDSDGNVFWVKGTASFYGVVPPPVNNTLLPIATVYQTWNANTMKVVPDGVKVVPMQDIAHLSDRIDYIMAQLAQNRLTSDVMSRDSGISKGIFADPFIDDSLRDAGISQNAAVVNGALMLPISVQVARPSLDVSSPQIVPFSGVVAISQEMTSGTMQINPYLAFTPPPAPVTLNPQIDRWTETRNNVVSSTTQKLTQTYGSGILVTYDHTTTQTTQTVTSTTTNIDTLRQIPIRFSIQGFGPGEQLTQCLFDGVPVTPQSV